MTSSRPYLIRAVYDWIVDNGLTPYLLVNAELPSVMVPMRYVENGKIVLNLSPHAVTALNLSNTQIQFSARFGGVSSMVDIPPLAVLAIYAKENGKGMVFRDEEGETPPPPSTPSSEGGSEKPTRPVLKVVK